MSSNPARHLRSFLPSFAIVDTAGEHDNKRAREVCAGVLSGEIVIIDKAYVDFLHLAALDERGVFWATRAKGNMKFRALGNLSKPQGNIVKNQRVAPQGKREEMIMSRVEAWVELHHEWQVMVFITNNFDWSPQSVRDLYRRRWDIEVFFKRVKQSLKLGRFLGHGFTRLFAVGRSTVWERIDLLALLKFHGRVSGRFRVLGALNQAWLPGFAPSNT